MSMGTMHICKTCGCELTLDCGEFIITEKDRGEVLDLTLTCENECGAPVLNAFVPLADFQDLS